MTSDVERGGASSVTKFENGSWIDAEPRPAVPSRGLDRLSLSCSRCMRNPAIVQGASWHFAPTWLAPELARGAGPQMFEFHETTIAPLVECPTATGKSFWAPGQTSPPRMPGEVRKPKRRRRSWSS
jgi:hypothetical protein